ncbi:MAG TPA: Fic family protein [Thermomicrobiales bacterium]|nr:Fic family protein [Thermomicrobiales bacterium]
MTDDIELQSANTAAAYQYAVAFHSEFEGRNPYQVSVIFELHAIISKDLYDFAGQERTAIHEVEIGGASITPAPAYLIKSGLVDLCEDVAKRAGADLSFDDAVRLSAELLHRLLVIHPFQDGNGRTARAFHLMALYDLGLLTPPLHIFDYVAYRRSEYLECLHEADEGDYEPLCEYIRRGLYDTIEQLIANAVSGGPYREFYMRRLNRKAKRFLDRRYRLGLTGTTYERERRHFLRSITRVAQAASLHEGQHRNPEG